LCLVPPTADQQVRPLVHWYMRVKCEMQTGEVARDPVHLMFAGRELLR
jgi:hypothetical protein